MNICILGCSFGVPDNGCPAEYHTENQLKLLGHRVYNFARRGSSNLESLAIAEKYFSITELKMDLIIWFHTELIRDSGFLEDNFIPFDLNETMKVVYSNFQKFFTSQNCKIAIIGGAAPVHPFICNFIKPDFCIPSWFNKILNLDLPQIQTLSRLDYIESLQDIGMDKKLEILKQHEEILNALEQSQDFPDNYHPGPRPHMELAKELNEIFF